MLSYQHIFHAGNFADILKHIAITLTVEYFKKKEKPFTVFESHAGAALYSLSDERAVKTGEFHNGIEKFIFSLKKDEIPSSVKEILAPYTELVLPFYEKGFYPGSPLFELNLMRKNDSLILSELHPATINELKNNIKTEVNNLKKSEKNPPAVNIHFRNGIEMLDSLTPPKTVRGIAVIDPSFEEKSEYEEIPELILRVHKKWTAGTIILWYPLIERRSEEILLMKEKIRRGIQNNEEKTLDIQLKIKEAEEMTGLSNLYGTGIFIVNPVFGISEKLNEVTSFLENLFRK